MPKAIPDTSIDTCRLHTLWSYAHASQLHVFSQAHMHGHKLIGTLHDGGEAHDASADGQAFMEVKVVCMSIRVCSRLEVDFGANGF